MDVTDRRGTVALVSGFARPPGIGRATALRLLREGASCFCVDAVCPDDVLPAHTGVVRRSVYEQVDAELRAVGGPGRVETMALDAESPLPWSEVVAAARTALGRLDVCCALSGATGASAGDGPLLDVDDDAWRACVELNLTGPWQLAKAAARAMIANGTSGAIVLLSSQSARVPAAGAGALGTARAGLGLLVEALAAELAPHGIRCNAVAPLAVGPSALFPNPGLVALAERERGSLEAWTRQRLPLRRLQDADETAAVVDFLCSDAASYVTGVTVPVTGGGR